MQSMRIMVGVSLVILSASAAMAQKVTTDDDKSTDFSGYRTFMWIKEPQTDNPLVQRRVVDDVNAALSAKGLRLVASDADLGIAAHATTQKGQTLNTFYDGFGGGWRWQGGGLGTATTTVDTYTVGTLIVDIFDARTKEAIWRGTSSGTLSGNPRRNAANLNKGIAKMLEQFPPKGTGAARD